MGQSQRVTQFMQGDTEYVEVGANVPGFRLIEVHVAGQRLGRDRRRRKGVGQYAAGPVEGKSVAVIPWGEQEVNRLVGRRRSLPPEK